MKSFKEYIIEFTDHKDYEGSSLFVLDSDGKLHMRHTNAGQIKEHPDTFPEFNFGRSTSWEADMGMGDIHRERPEPVVHGRINHEKRMIQLITKHGGPAAYGDPRILPDGGPKSKKSKHDVRQDAMNRLKALKSLEPYRNTYWVYHSHTEAHPVLHSFTEHEKYLAELLK